MLPGATFQVGGDQQGEAGGCAQLRGEGADRVTFAAKDDEPPDAEGERPLDLGRRGGEAAIGIPPDGGEEELGEFAQGMLGRDDSETGQPRRVGRLTRAVRGSTVRSEC